MRYPQPLVAQTNLLGTRRNLREKYHAIRNTYSGSAEHCER